MFSPVAGSLTSIDVTVGPIPSAIASLYGGGQYAPYWVSLSCTNGFFASQQLVSWGGNDLHWNQILPAGALGGRCFFATWDNVALHLTHATVVQNSGTTSTSIPGVEVSFTP